MGKGRFLQEIDKKNKPPRAQAGGLARAYYGMDAIIITGEELRALGFACAPDGDYLIEGAVAEWLIECDLLGGDGSQLTGLILPSS